MSENTTVPKQERPEAAPLQPLRLAIVDNDGFTLAALTSFVPKAVPASVIHWKTSSPIEAMEKAIDPVTMPDMPQIALGVSRLRCGKTFSPLEEVHFDSAEVAYERITHEPKTRPRKPMLSVHESRIMELLSQGFKYSQIAAELGNSESSVRTEARRAVKKLGAATLSQAVVIWVLGQRT